MKYLLLSASITIILASCNFGRENEIKYDVYSCVLETRFGYLSPDSGDVVLINDTIKDFENQMLELIGIVKNDDKFFTNCCEADSSFKPFILSIKKIRTDEEKMELEHLQSKTKLNINLNKQVNWQQNHHTINLSKVIFNTTKDKGIVFISDNSSGYWVFVGLSKNGWRVKHEIMHWLTIG